MTIRLSLEKKYSSILWSIHFTLFGFLFLHRLTALEDNENSISVAVGQPILLTLPGNASTGFTWMLTVTHGNSVILSGQSTFIPNSNLPGSGGIFNFQLQAVKPGQTHLSFAYEQPWNPQNIIQTFDITIDATNAIYIPAMTITTSEKKVSITWPISDSAGFFIEGASTLAPPNWTAMNVIPLINGTNYVVTIGASGSNLFFRLRK